MTDVLVNGRVIPIPPGFRIRIVLEQLDGPASTLQEIETDELERQRQRAAIGQDLGRRGTAAPSKKERGSEQGWNGGARPAGTEHLPGIDELDPLPTMRRRNGEAPRAQLPAPRKPGTHGKVCPGCERRCGPSTRTCPTCDHRFFPKASE